MGKICLKKTFECLGLQIIFAIVSVGLYTGYVPVLFSIFTAWLFTWSIHSTFWQLGNKERKRVNIVNKNLRPSETKEKQNIFNGAIIALPFFLINLLFLIFTCVLNINILITIQSILQFAFAGFLSPVDDALGFVYFIPRFLVCLWIYIICIGGYISGSYNYSFLDKYFYKIVYKTKKEENKQ